jgi:drug/metabolite transporter (DMT)-like permease
MKHWKNNLMLTATAMIWGCGFVAQSVSMDSLGPWTFNCIRFFMAGCTIFAMIPAVQRISGVSAPAGIPWKAGLCCGLFLGTASICQQFGVMTTSVGKSGFITALYVVLVPVLSSFLGKRIRPMVWLSVAIAVTGLYFLSVKGSLQFETGDLWLIACAFLFAMHIMVIDHFTPHVSGVKMSCLQFFVAALFCLGPMLAWESPSLAGVQAAIVPLLYSGICSCGIAYTLQIVGQKGADPTVASMLLSLESVFAAIAGFLLLHQQLSIRELLGGALMFAAIILSQLPERSSAAR